MKKFLKASSAIVGAALVASVAHADNTIGGTVRFAAGLGGDADNGSDAMNFRMEGIYLGFSGSKTTDTGLTLSGGVNFSESQWGYGQFNPVGSHQQIQVDKTYANIAGGFGNIALATDGDASDLVGKAVSLGVGDYFGTGLFASSGRLTAVTPQHVYLRGHSGINQTSPRVTYTTNNINGLTAGFTLLRLGGDAEYDATKEGQITATTGSLTTGTVGKTVAAKLGEKGHIEGTAIAVNYSVAGVSAGYATTSSSKSLTVKGQMTATENGDYKTENSQTRINLGYSTGPFSVGYTITTGTGDEVSTPSTPFEAKKGDGAKANAETNSTALGLAFNYGAGTVSLVRTTEDVDDPKGRINLTDDVADDAKAIDATGLGIGVEHQVADGLKVYLNQWSGDTEPTEDKPGELGSGSETVLGVKVSF